MNNIPPEIKENDKCIDTFIKEYNAHYLSKGYWINLDIKNGNWRIWDCKCSVCGMSPLRFVGGSENWWLSSLPIYCPSCGSKMETNIEENKKIDISRVY